MRRPYPYATSSASAAVGLLQSPACERLRGRARDARSGRKRSATQPDRAEALHGHHVGAGEVPRQGGTPTRRSRNARHARAPGIRDPAAQPTVQSGGYTARASLVHVGAGPESPVRGTPHVLDPSNPSKHSMHERLEAAILHAALSVLLSEVSESPYDIDVVAANPGSHWPQRDIKRVFFNPDASVPERWVRQGLFEVLVAALTSVNASGTAAMRPSTNLRASTSTEAYVGRAHRWLLSKAYAAFSRFEATDDCRRARPSAPADPRSPTDGRGCALTTVSSSARRSSGRGRQPPGAGRQTPLAAPARTPAPPPRSSL